MKKHWKPILTLALLSVLLTEVLSGSTPLPVFIQPIVFILFVTVGYGFPVLIIREIFVRKGWGLLQLFCMGFGYGLYNEGLFARTIFSPFHSPSASFAVYGLIGGVRIPWLLAIASWHALFAVIFPIVLVHYLFPLSAQEPWLNSVLAWVLGVLGLGFGVLDFIGKNAFSMPGGYGHLVFMFACWLALWLLALWLPRVPKVLSQPSSQFAWSTPAKGMALFVLFYIIPLVLGGLQVPLLLFIAYFAAVCVLLGWRLSKVVKVPLAYMVALALGGEIGLGILSIVLAFFGGGPIQIATDLVFLIIFVFALLTLKRNERYAHPI